MDRGNADDYIDREILATGMAMENMLEEIMKKVAVLSATVEGIAIRMVVLEQALRLKRNERGYFEIEKCLTFLGLEGGPATGTTDIV